MNKTIRDYLSEIGKKGGMAGKGVKHDCDPVEAKARAKRAAEIRWQKVRDAAVGIATVAMWLWLGYRAAVVLAG